MANASHLKQAPVKMTERKLHDYISEISGRADIRAVLPLPLGARKKDRVLICAFRPSRQTASEEVK